MQITQFLAVSLFSPQTAPRGLDWELGFLTNFLYTLVRQTVLAEENFCEGLDRLTHIEKGVN